MNGGGLTVVHSSAQILFYSINFEFVHVCQVLNSAVILIVSIPWWGQKRGECPV